MTGPVTTEALVEALTQFLLDRSGETLWQCEARAKAIIAGPLAPLLAAHQQQSASIGSLEESVNSLEADLQRVTAERDEHAEALMKVAEVGGWQASAGLYAEVRSRLTAAEARAAQLQAEVEAKDRALQEALKAAIRAWSAKLHIPVTRMMSRELRTEFSAALAARAAAPEAQGADIEDRLSEILTDSQRQDLSDRLLGAYMAPHGGLRLDNAEVAYLWTKLGGAL